jgi:FkbM family methyltransferase
LKVFYAYYADLLYFIFTLLIRIFYWKVEDLHNTKANSRHGNMIRLSKAAERIFSVLLLIVPQKYRYEHTKIVSYDDCWVTIRPFIFSEILMVSGRWEFYVKQILDDELKIDDVFVDIGANIGIYAVPYAKKIKRIIAFEPDPKSAKLLLQSIQLNDAYNIELRQKAVGSSRQRVRYYLSSVPMTSGMTMANEILEELEVETTDLDTELLYESKVDWLLIDVEGSEIGVLVGAKKLLKQYSPKIILECNKKNITKVSSILAEERYQIRNIYDIYYYCNKIPMSEHEE